VCREVNSSKPEFPNALGALFDTRTANTASNALGALFDTRTANLASKALGALAVALRDIRRT